MLKERYELIITKITTPLNEKVPSLSCKPKVIFLLLQKPYPKCVSHSLVYY